MRIEGSPVRESTFSALYSFISFHRLPTLHGRRHRGCCAPRLPPRACGWTHTGLNTAQVSLLIRMLHMVHHGQHRAV